MFSNISQKVSANGTLWATPSKDENIVSIFHAVSSFNFDLRVMKPAVKSSISAVAPAGVRVTDTLSWTTKLGCHRNMKCRVTTTTVLRLPVASTSSLIVCGFQVTSSKSVILVIVNWRETHGACAFMHDTNSTIKVTCPQTFSHAVQWC